MKFLTIQFTFHEVSEPNTTQGIILSEGDTKVTCCVDIMRQLCHPHTNTHVNKHNHVGGLRLDYDWQVPAALTGVMELTITH